MGNLRRLRGRRGLTQEELAERSGVNVTTVWYVESKGTEPLPQTRRKLAVALGVSSEEVHSYERGFPCAP